MNRGGFFLTTSLLAGLFGSGLDAQITSKQNQVVGWVNVQVSTRNVGELHWLDYDRGCGTQRTMCQQVGSLSQSPFLGGTAYDSRNQTLWLASSSVIEQIDLQNCRVVCWVGSTKVGKGVVSGMTISPKNRRLWTIETDPGYLGIQEYDISNCKPKPVKGTRVALKTNETSCGIAYDEENDLLIYVVTVAGRIPQNRLVVARPSDPGNQLCSIAVPNCPPPQRTFYDVTGMTYDECSKTLHLTDGTSLKQAKFTDLPNCKATFTACCQKDTSNGARFRSLSLMPAWAQKSLGNGCASAPCTRCLRTTLSTMGGDPALGNPSFGFELTYAPQGSVGVMFLGGGACSTGIKLPFLCVPFYPQLAGMIMSPAITTTGTSCSATAKYPLPIPVMTALCNQKFCTQVLTLCPSSQGVGWGGSNGLEFNISH